MTFFINGIKLTTLDAGSSGFLLLCRDLFISFCFLFKFREQDKCARAFEDPHPSAASVWERQRGGGDEGGSQPAAAPDAFWQLLQCCASRCH